tara:strand:+ start:65 stop:805 length:741 start_codon:yes stop_codon:yes gene_type:complete
MTIKNSETEKAETETENTIIDNAAPNESKSFDVLASTLSDNMSEVQEHAIEEEQRKDEKHSAQFADLKDSEGNSFDPAIHKTNKAGEPTTSTKGKLIKKPAGGAKSGRPKSGSTIGGAAAAPTPEQTAKIQSRASGKMAANLVLTMGIVAGGEEWQPMSDPLNGLDEKAMLEGAFADYFEATGKTDIPPNMALAVALGAYALPRFTMPKTQSRMQKLKLWITKKAADRKLKKHGLKAEPISDDKKA